jgi:hypothetical protein
MLEFKSFFKVEFNNHNLLYIETSTSLGSRVFAHVFFSMKSTQQQMTINMFLSLFRLAFQCCVFTYARSLSSLLCCGIINKFCSLRVHHFSVTKLSSYWS